MAAEWYFKELGKEYGPVTSADLRRLAHEGRIGPETWVRKGSDGRWAPASKVKGLFRANSYPGDGREQEQRPLLPQPAPRPKSPVHVDPEPLYPPPIPRFVTTHHTPVDADSMGTSIFPTSNRSLLWGGASLGALLVLSSIFAVIFWSSGKDDTGKRAAAEPTPAESKGTPPKQTPPVRKTLTTEEIVSRCERSVASITGKMNSGTGFLVQPGILATNAHVISLEFLEDLEIQFPSPQDSQRRHKVVELLFKDFKRDLVLLKVSTDLPPLEFPESYDFRSGQDVIVIGKDGAGGQTLTNAVSRGVMSSKTTLNGKLYYQIGLSINKGNSGSPVIDSTGRVIGIATFKVNDNKEELALCIPLEDLTASLKTVDLHDKNTLSVVASTHRAESAVVRLIALCAAYEFGLDAFMKGMEKVERGGNPNDAYKDISNDVTAPVKCDAALSSEDVKANVSRIASDTNLKASLRDKVVELWMTYTEMKNYLLKPPSNCSSQSINIKKLELVRKYKLLCQALKIGGIY